MEADSPPNQCRPDAADVEPSNDCGGLTSPNENGCLPDENEADITIHGFNSISNVTVIEKLADLNESKKLTPCEGSDSGVEVLENVECAYQRNLSSNSGTSQDFDNLNCARSCDSSIISYCSNYEEAYNLLVRKNSTLLEGYRRNEDVTSENGSESSSVSGPQTRINRRSTVSSTKKKLSNSETKNKGTNNTDRDRSRNKPPLTPRSSAGTARIKSIDRLQGKTSASSKGSTARSKNTTLTLDVSRRDKRPSSATARTSSNTRTPSTTPTDDGRWPSINSKPAPLMSRSMRGQLESPKPKITAMDTKTIEKYATLPRRSKEKTADKDKETKVANSRENTMTKKTSRMSNSLFIPKVKQKVKIYHESCVQTALTLTDLENALSGIPIKPKNPKDSETCDKECHVDLTTPEMNKTHDSLKHLSSKYESLLQDYKLQSEKLKETESKLKEEALEKDSLREELENSAARVLALLGVDTETNLDSSSASDSLLALETRFHNVGHVVIKQEEEISKLNNLCRTLQMELEKSIAAQRLVLQQQQELETESMELQEFMQAEKSTLHDALKESEAELHKQQLIIAQKDKDLAEKQEECKHLQKLSEQRRQENVSLQARLNVLESKSRELLVHQGSSVSGAAVALSALIGRLDGLVEELVIAYSISDQELDDVIFHNEAYKNSSSPESTPEKSRKYCEDRTPSPQKSSSFVSAVINAIKNAAQSPFNREVSKDTLSTDRSSSNEMLDSETEPCLMMEHVLEDVVIPDGHSHNMISSGHGSLMSSSLTHSESLKDISQALMNRQSERASISFCGSLNTSYTSDIVSLNDIFPSISLVDQVIDVDNLITRLLKVIRIIQLENEECMNELQEHKENLMEQIGSQKETNKVVCKQLKDWETLGEGLKTEVKELMAQSSKKNLEMDTLKTELNKQREEVEKLNQDVCELSTALAKAEFDTKIKEDEVTEQIKKWEKTGEMPSPEILARLIVTHDEVPVLKQKLAEKEKHLQELTQEFLASRQVLSESLKDALTESKKQYDAIDNALEVLHSIQSVVKNCAPLCKLQRDLEDISFQSASALPIVPSDCNANAALLQAVANMKLTTRINTSA